MQTIIMQHAHMSNAFVLVVLIQCAKTQFLSIKITSLWRMFFILVLVASKQKAAQILIV